MVNETESDRIKLAAAEARKFAAAALDELYERTVVVGAVQVECS